MNKFAKLYESDKYGQIVVIQQGNDEGNPEIRFFAMPENLGVCSVAIQFDDSDTAWDSCDTAFEKATLEMAENAVEVIFDAAKKY